MAAVGDADFSFTAAGLARALELLRLHLDAEPGARHGGAGRRACGGGVGSEAALEALAPSIIGGAARLGAPGFLARMDPRCRGDESVALMGS
ncbi:MAG: hypothetical protein ACRDNX_07465 [Gaiellaceae bacterium]